MPVFQGRYAVVAKARRAAPDSDIVMTEREFSSGIAARATAELEDRRQAK
jgi:hypothetical protein